MSMSNEVRIAVEKRIVRALIRHMRAKGWAVFAVFDGDGTRYPRFEAEVMAEVFNLDEVSLRFAKAEHLARMARPAVDGDGLNDWGPRGVPVHGVLLVLGNGEDVLSDWNYTEGDPDGFDAAVKAFDSEAVVARGLKALAG
jgi:hypothetical protein